MKVGDYVKLKTKQGEIKGLVVPSTDSKLVILKQDSGYNLAVERSDILRTSRIYSKKQELKTYKEVKHKKGLKNITILHTGGTIASKVDYKTGGVISRFKPEELIAMYPELARIANLNARLVRNMWSEQMRFAHFNLLAKEVAKEEKKSDGIIITQGTDTLAYTAAALAFILEDINIPVLIVGAQRSSDRGSSDAAFNLTKACKFISETDFVGVAICMHGSSEDKEALILPACKTKKLHSSRRDAFRPVNTLPIARVIDKVQFLDKYRKKGDRKLTVKLLKETLKIGIVKVHPNMFAAELKCYENFNGLVIEATGLGQMPIEKIDVFTQENASIFTQLKKLLKKIPVVLISQCIFGRVHMHVYEPAVKLKQAGVLGDHTDMTTEAALIKLAWLLSNDKKNLKQLWDKNLRGELSSRTKFKEEII